MGRAQGALGAAAAAPGRGVGRVEGRREGRAQLLLLCLEQRRPRGRRINRAGKRPRRGAGFERRTCSIISAPPISATPVARPGRAQEGVRGLSVRSPLRRAPQPCSAAQGRRQMATASAGSPQDDTMPPAAGVRSLLVVPGAPPRPRWAETVENIARRHPDVKLCILFKVGKLRLRGPGHTGTWDDPWLRRPAYNGTGFSIRTPRRRSTTRRSGSSRRATMRFLRWYVAVFVPRAVSGAASGCDTTSQCEDRRLMRRLASVSLSRHRGSIWCHSSQQRAGRSPARAPFQT